VNKPSLLGRRVVTKLMESRCEVMFKGWEIRGQATAEEVLIGSQEAAQAAAESDVAGRLKLVHADID